MKLAIYDLEIQKAIPTEPREPRDPGLEYCGDWGDHENMGISIGCIKLEAGAEGFWEDGIIPALRILKLAGYKVGGFNTKRFDDKLIAVHGLEFTSDFDILEMVLDAAGFHGAGEFWEDPRYKGRSYKLSRLCEANGMAKTGTGENAPKLWQTGRFTELHQYCMNDVEVEWRILELLLAGELADPNTGEKLRGQL
jgi:hypothetical protein